MPGMGCIEPEYISELTGMSSDLPQTTKMLDVLTLPCRWTGVIKDESG